jgi:hypothetical protein
MSRRGRSGPTISLFSFQDIITSVTAIVTVIALLLALDLVQRKQSKSSDSSAAMAVNLTEQLKRTEAELAQLQAATEATDELVREVAATSPAELRNEVAQRESAIEELQRERIRREEQSLEWKAREKVELAEQFDLEPLKEEFERTVLATSAVEKQLAEETAENRMIFTLPKGLEKEGWLAVIDSREIAIAPLGRAAIPTTFASTGNVLFGSSAADNFEKWALEQRRGSAYFLLLIRPGADNVFDKVHQILERKSFEHGFDLIGADQRVLHPERGAAP